MRKINPDVLIVIASGFTKDESVSELLPEGLTDFISKPYRQAQLAKMIENIMGVSDQSA